MSRRNPIRVALVLLVVAALYWVERREEGASPGADGLVRELYESRRSGVMVEGAGFVRKLLPDDLEGSRHQRFILELSSGHTLLVSHNIDLAERVNDLERGDAVAFRGQYEWNERGGVVHWTHRDPDGDRPGGWLEHAGRRYR